jgi:hypothetical protein
MVSGFSAVLGALAAELIVDDRGHYRWGIAFALAIGLLGFVAVVPLVNRGRAGALTAVRS